MLADIVFTSHNRLRYTAATLEALLRYTNWEDHAHRLIVVDDNSSDGTAEYLGARIENWNGNRICYPEITFLDRPTGGPTESLNRALDHCSADFVAKIDNDCIVCPGWLDHMHTVLHNNPVLDALGMEPGFGDPVAPLDQPRYPLRARWIGGVFVARAWCFRQRPVMNDRWFGMTSFWRKHTTAWITPALPCFLLDHIGLEPWKSLAAEYIEKGWARPWESYFEAPEPYWSWWVEQQVAA